jgi:hypothetical protein
VGLPARSQDLYRVPHASYAILEKTVGGWNASLNRVGYDWNAAARQARNLGREDWARGIATGRMV